MSEGHSICPKIEHMTRENIQGFLPVVPIEMRKLIESGMTTRIAAMRTYNEIRQFSNRVLQRERPCQTCVINDILQHTPRRQSA